MKPARIPSKWVKILPWYYAERRQVARQEADYRAILTELEADDDF